MFSKVQRQQRWRSPALAVLWLGWLGAAQGQPAEITTSTRGAQIYQGQVVLSGQLRGHDQALPADALRCTNCHEASRQPARDDSSGAPAVAANGNRSGSASSSFAPRLDQASLAWPQARRGGPPTRYDQAAFCRVLRTSIDPGDVLLNKPMPRYTLSNDDCAALWQFLSQRPTLPAGSP